MYRYNTEQFEKDLNHFNIFLSEKQVEQFVFYYEMLVEWNRKVNLTAITDYENVIKKHFVDSLSLVKAFDLRQPVSVIDVGTGAGFPGIPLKIAFPDLKVVMIDSLNKRIQFVNKTIETLKLNQVEVIHGRAEDLAQQEKFRENFDLCVSRAVANLSTLSEYCLPFVKQGGLFISYKSEKISEEIEAAQKAIFILGGKLERQIDFMLPDSDIYRNLVVIRKQKITPRKYPRRAGVPLKEKL